MKIDCILTATNLEPMYCDFIPMFVKAWNKLVPEADVKIILIADNIPEQFVEYKDNIVLFKPIIGVSTAFTAQYIRILYPAILGYSEGVMITDMDCIPLNRKYFVDNIKSINSNEFVYYRNVLLDERQIAMMYNIGSSKTWSDIFEVYTLEDVTTKLASRFKSLPGYAHASGGWYTDQLDLFHYVMNWSRSGKFICLPDTQTGFCRLDRHTFNKAEEVEAKVKDGYFCDYHAFRPYQEYKEINDKILEYINSEV